MATLTQAHTAHLFRLHALLTESKQLLKETREALAEMDARENLGGLSDLDKSNWLNDYLRAINMEAACLAHIALTELRIQQAVDKQFEELSFDGE